MIKEKKSKKVPSECHPDRLAYGHGMCEYCYQKWYHTQKATCHPEKRVFLRGLCEKCYRKDVAKKRPSACHPEKPAISNKTGTCQSCYDKEYNLRRTPEEKERRRNKKREWLKMWRANKSPEEKRIKYLKGKKSRYGLSVEEYQRILDSQNGRCAICKNPPSEKRELDIDHDHNTGKVRGLLCQSCNIGIGFLKDDYFLVRTAADYIYHNGEF